MGENNISREELIKPSLEIEESEVEINFNYKFADEKLTHLPHKNIFIGISGRTDILKCDFCSFTHNNQNDLSMHVKKTHEDNCFVCLNCEQAFFTANQLFDHKQSDQCLKSGQFFHISNQLNNYEQSTHLNLITCKKCNKTFTKEYYFSIHLKIHIENEKNISCPTCENKFSTVKSLKCHLYNVHNRILKCNICYKTFSKTNNLKDHMNRHTNTKPFQCLDCKEAFFSRTQLYIHNKTNGHLNPMICITCSKSFTTKIQLRRHLKTHPETAKLTCYICNLSFARTQGFKQHMNRHLGSKPYKCLHCGEAFITSRQFYAHKSSRCSQSSHSFII